MGEEHVQTPRPQLLLTADACLVQGGAKPPQNGNGQQGTLVLWIFTWERPHHQSHQQHNVHNSAAHQAHPAREAQEAEGQGGKDGAGQAVHDYKKPEFFQTQIADTIGLWRE